MTWKRSFVVPPEISLGTTARTKVNKKENTSYWPGLSCKMAEWITKKIISLLRRNAIFTFLLPVFPIYLFYQDSITKDRSVFHLVSRSRQPAFLFFRLFLSDKSELQIYYSSWIFFIPAFQEARWSLLLFSRNTLPFYTSGSASPINSTFTSLTFMTQFQNSCDATTCSACILVRVLHSWFIRLWQLSGILFSRYKNCAK